VWTLFEYYNLREFFRLLIVYQQKWVFIDQVGHLLCFDVLSGVWSFDIECNCFSCEGFYENLHDNTAIKNSTDKNIDGIHYKKNTVCKNQIQETPTYNQDLFLKKSKNQQFLEKPVLEKLKEEKAAAEKDLDHALQLLSHQLSPEIDSASMYKFWINYNSICFKFLSFPRVFWFIFWDFMVK